MPSSTPTSRHFTETYKRRILKEHAACTSLDEKRALLHREQLRSDYISRWQQGLDRPTQPPAPAPASTPAPPGTPPTPARCPHCGQGVLAQESSARLLEEYTLLNQRITDLDGRFQPLRRDLKKALLLVEIQDKIIHLLRMG